MGDIFHAWQHIFQLHLIFYNAIAFAFGIAYAFTDRLVFFITSFVLSFIFLFRKISYSLIFIFVFTIGFGLAQIHVHPICFSLPATGVAKLEFDRIMKVEDPILSKWKGVGHLIHFETENGDIVEKVPFVMNFAKKPSVTIQYEYTCDVTLSHVHHHTFYLNPHAGECSKIKKASWSKPIRRDLKNSVKKTIHQYTNDSHVKALYNALLTGELNDLLLSFYFQKLGLQHLLAISGFHFGIVCLFLSFLIKKWLNKTASTLVMIGITTLYFFYLGISPSILRAWVATVSALYAKFLNGRVRSLNILGFGMFINLVLFPIDIYHIGFQLTYSATFGIITLSHYVEEKLSFMFPSSHRIKKIFLSAFSINISTFFTTIPILLLQFKKFPLLSFFYNLYAPFCITVIMILLLLGLFFSVLPFLGKLLFFCCNYLTALMLQSFFDYPRHLDFVLYFPYITPSLCIIFMFIIGLFAMFLLEKSHPRYKLYPTII